MTNKQTYKNIPSLLKGGMGHPPLVLEFDCCANGTIRNIYSVKHIMSECADLCDLRERFFGKMEMKDISSI